MADYEATGEVEDLTEQYKGDEGIVERWLTEIKILHKSKSYEDFKKTGDILDDVYRNKGVSTETVSIGRAVFNFFWANVQTLKPTLYSRLPKPVAERRLKRNNDITRLASEIAETTTTFSLSIEQNNFNSVAKYCVQDRLLCGLGAACVDFEAEFGKDGQVVPGTEKASTRYIPWRDFFWTPAGHWSDVRACGDATYHSRESLIKHFGEVGKKVELHYQADNIKSYRMGSEKKEMFKKARVWRIWDKDTKQVFFISEGYKKAPLKVISDPWKLDGFFPYPEPLLATITTDDLVPTSDYDIIKKILDEIEQTGERLIRLRECCKWVGAHDGTESDNIKQIQNLADGQTWPVKRWVEHLQAGGFKGLIDWIDIEQLTRVIQQLQEYYSFLKNELWEISGLPDIVRGNSEPNRTATEQQYKGQFATLRLADKQQDVQRFCRDLISMKAQLIFELFSPEAIGAMCGYEDLTKGKYDEMGQLIEPGEQENYPAALELLQNDTMRQFKIDIETDSTIAIDEESYRASVSEFLASMAAIAQQTSAIVQIDPNFMPIAYEGLAMGARAFRTGRQIEGLIESAKKSWEQAQQEPPAEEPIDPAVIKAQADQMIAQMTEQRKQVEGQLKAENESAKIQHTAMLKQYEIESKNALKEKELEFKTILQTKELALKAEQVRADMAEQLAKTTMAQQQPLIDELTAQRTKATQQPQIFVTLPSGNKAITLPDGRQALVHEIPPDKMQ